MIYDIYVENSDADYRDVRLDMAIVDYSEDTFSVILTCDLRSRETGLCDVMFAATGHLFVPVAKGDVPEWVKRMIVILTPKMYEVMSDPKARPIVRFLDEGKAA